MRPRLLATDLDGTLLRPDATMSLRVAEALAAAEEAGLRVVILTARSWRSLRAIVTDAVPRGLAVCSNGAVLYDLASDAIVRSHHFEPAVLRDFVERMRTSLDVAVAWETATRVFRSARFHELATPSPNISGVYLAAVEFEEEISENHLVTKLLVRHETMSPEELLAALEPIAQTVTLTASGGQFVEAMAPGITKASALAALCDELGITAEEVVAVGDHTNDLPMLLWAGQGIAMGNAHGSVLDVIPERTATNAEDGLALVIEALLN